MNQSQPKTYQMNEQEFACFMRVINITTVASAALAASGLVGIIGSVALSQFGGPENSHLAREVMHYSVPIFAIAGVATLLNAPNYYLYLCQKRGINKEKKDSGSNRL